MTSNVAKLALHGAQPPHLPPIAGEALDDAKEALAKFEAWQAGDDTHSKGEVAEGLGSAQRGIVAMLFRPLRRG